MTGQHDPAVISTMRRGETEGNGLRTNNFDPLAYIESAFLDREEEDGPAPDDKLGDGLSVSIPSIAEYLSGAPAAKTALLETTVTEVEVEADAALDANGKKARFRKTVMSAPRPRRAKKGAPGSEPVIDPELQQIWQALPKNVAFLCSFYDDSVTKNYYRGEFKESRQDLIRRLLDPVLSLEETSRLLGVCPATVRRYTNRGWLEHHRTDGGQRRFRLSDIVKFVDEHGRFPEE